MKNVKMVRENVGRVLDFKTDLEMMYFVMKYKDLFKPYCEDTVKSERKYNGETAASLAKEFGIKAWFYAEDICRINVNFKNKEAFDSVEHLFRKEHLRRGRNSYVYVGES